MTDLHDTRRTVLKLGGIASVASVAGCLPGLVGATQMRTIDPNDGFRGQFDELDEELHEDGGLLGETNDSDGSPVSGLLAWGESYVMSAYLLMYRAFGDTEYLDRFIEHADAVLENRDSVRGVTDFRGESGPVWRADTPYTIGRTELLDDHGRAVLEVRSATSYADQATVTISSAFHADSFDLTVRNPALDRTTEYEGLSMDRESPDYVVSRINREGFRDEGPDRCRVTVADRRDPDGTGPVPGEFDLETPHYAFVVHTGMITFPLASFARLVAEDQSLQDQPRYEERAQEYQSAAADAVDAHDHQWRETDDGEGYYVFAPGSPTPYESVSLPHNQSLSLGRTVIQLAALTDGESYAERARRLAQTFRNDLVVDEGDAHVWSYYWTDGQLVSGWSMDDPASVYRPWEPGIDDPLETSPEDVSHGHIDVSFASLSFDAAGFERWEPTFTDVDMARFARTYTENVATEVDDTPATNRFVDGTGPTAGTHETMGPTWAVLTPWDDDVFEHSSAHYDAELGRFGPRPETLLGVATLRYWAQHV